MAVGAAPFGEMPSNREILQRVRALMPEAARHEPDQHVVSKVILKQFTEPYRKKGELLLASLDVRHPERKIVRGGSARFGKIPNYLRFASSSAEDLWSKTETRLQEPLEAVRRDDRLIAPAHEAVVRDAIALHFIRSIPTAALHQTTWRERREAARQQWRGVGLANADEIVLLLTPHHVIVLGQGPESRQATDNEVDRYNTLQVRIAYCHVYFRPGSGLASFVRSLLGAEAA